MQTVSLVDMIARPLNPLNRRGVDVQVCESCGGKNGLGFEILSLELITIVPRVHRDGSLCLAE
jgi:hypothetical protein